MIETILVDQDEVLAAWNATFQRHIVEHSPHIEFPFLKDNVNWDLTAGLDEEGIRAVNETMAKAGLYADMDIVPGAPEALNEMLDNGYEVFVVTSPYITNPTCASDKLDWLEKNIGPGWAKRAILTSDKTLIRGDILIDDKPNIEGVMKPVWEHILFTQSYNLAHTNGRRRLDSWADWRSVVEEELELA